MILTHVLRAILSIFLVFPVCCYAQRNVDITVKFYNCKNKFDDMLLVVDSSLTKQSFKLQVNESDHHLSQETCSSVSDLTFIYRSGNESTAKTFFVQTSNPVVSFYCTNATKSPLDSIHTENIKRVDQVGAKEFYAYIESENRDYVKTIQDNAQSMSDSVLTEIFRKESVLTRKKIKFVSEYADRYYSFWIFKTQLIYSSGLPKDSLLRMLGKFDDKLVSDCERDRIASIIAGVYLYKGNPMPDFKVTKLDGSSLSLEDIHEKYILLDFWASWCKPCIAEMPKLQEIIALFPPDALEVIHITRDKDVALARKAIQRHAIKGTHVKINSKVLEDFGAYAIPQVFLIGKDRKILYSREETVDIDLRNLESLAKELNKSN